MFSSTPRSAASCLVACALAVLPVTGAKAADTRPPRLDPLAQSVVDSLAFPPRTRPAELLDAAIRASDVEAYDVAARYFARLADLLEKAQDTRAAMLADLGDEVDPASLRRLERTLGATVADVPPIAAAIREAARQRRRDPARLARARDELGSESEAVRAAAYDRLQRTGVDALPVLVELLQTADAARGPARRLARQLVRDLSPAARQPLLAWLGSDDVEHWPGVIEALAATVTADEPADFVEFLLAPAVVPDVPAPTRQRAAALLARLTGDDRPGGEPPSADAARAIVGHRLDRTLSIAGLPAPDHLLTDTVRDPQKAALAASGTVERYVWNPQARRLERLDLPPRAARAQEAIHLARDLAALATEESALVRLVLLARLESLLVAGGPGAPEGIPTEQLAEAVTGPGGLDAQAVAGVLELAASRGLLPAATAAARVLAATPAAGPGNAAAATPTGDASAGGPAGGPAGGTGMSRLPPAARRALLAALAVPDAALQMECARTLAEAGGDPPYRGSSRVFEALLHMATGSGEDVAVVAHHEAGVREAIATDLSRFGYRIEKVGTGREAILATRAGADTVLVVLGARTITPSALETVQLIQRQPFGDVPPVLVAVDPLDDDARGKFLTCLILSFSDLDCVGVTDRLDSLFKPTIDPATGAVVGPPRLPDRLAEIAGPDAVSPGARQARAVARRTRAAQALALLADLGSRGWDVSAAETTARMGLMKPAEEGSPTDLFGPSAALLATIGTARAQQALLSATDRVDLPESARKAALAGFARSVDRYGVLLDCRPLREVQARYNRPSAADRETAGTVLDIIQTRSRGIRPVSADAAHSRPTR